ncbi:hypothetical protein HK102_003242 [Quaeritorhiza haematococci]|nr:hypothetical protein HK102_003242 [Quaeritorhiza haematococci]
MMFTSPADLVDYEYLQAQRAAAAPAIVVGGKYDPNSHFFANRPTKIRTSENIKDGKWHGGLPARNRSSNKDALERAKQKRREWINKYREHKNGIHGSLATNQYEDLVIMDDNNSGSATTTPFILMKRKAWPSNININTNTTLASSLQQEKEEKDSTWELL